MDKIIHFCWFGKAPKPPLVKRCINSWRKKLPEYEIFEWNENNFDFSTNRYAVEAYEAKKWAFVSDYVRLAVLFSYGGIYMDTDVEVVRSLNKFLSHGAFSGFEDDLHIPTATMGAIAGHPWIHDLLKAYKERVFFAENGAMDLTTNVVTITKDAVNNRELLLNGNYQILIDDIHIYPPDWFCAKNYRTGRLQVTNNTHTIHHFAASWLPMEARMKSRLIWSANAIIGDRFMTSLVQFKQTINRITQRNG